MSREWKVGDEVASTDGVNWFIHTIEAITPSGLLKIGDGVLLYPTLHRRGREPWSTWNYHAVTDEIRLKARRQWLVKSLSRTSWHNLPTSTLEAVHETLTRCKAEADAAANGGGEEVTK